MIVKTWITVDQEVAVEVDSDDVRAMLSEALHDGGEGSRVGNLLNMIAVCLRGISEEHIDALHPHARNVAACFFREQAERFGVPMTEVEV